jgi:hypothetical protein
MPVSKEMVGVAERVKTIQVILMQALTVDHSKFLTVANDAVDHLRYLTQHFPSLVTSEVKEAIARWEKFKQCRGSLEFAEPKQKEVVDQAVLAKTAIKLLEDHQMEDVMDVMAEQFSIDMDYPKLIGLIGKTRYRQALRHESRELQNNAISFDQMASLWNSLGKPALGGDRWTAHSISLLAE